MPQRREKPSLMWTSLQSDAGGQPAAKGPVATAPRLRLVSTGVGEFDHGLARPPVVPYTVRFTRACMQYNVCAQG